MVTAHQRVINITDMHRLGVCNQSAMPKLVDAFSERYRKLENGELLALALQRHQLESSALIALDSELAARNLGETALREFEDQFEQKAEPAEDVKPAAEDVTAEQLPPPSELPGDWFDEEADPSAVSLASSRPKGVTVGALMFWFSGIINVGFGTWIIFAGGSSLLSVIGSVSIVLGILSFIAGSGLWRLNPWGRALAEVLCWFGVTTGGSIIIAAAFWRMRGFAVDPGTIIYQFFGVLWQSLWLLYLSRKDIRQAFDRVPHGANNIPAK